jgi:hypothetical protein
VEHGGLHPWYGGAAAAPRLPHALSV